MFRAVPGGPGFRPPGPPALAREACAEGGGGRAGRTRGAPRRRSRPGERGAAQRPGVGLPAGLQRVDEPSRHPRVTWEEGADAGRGFGDRSQEGVQCRRWWEKPVRDLRRRSGSEAGHPRPRPELGTGSPWAPPADPHPSFVRRELPARRPPPTWPLGSLRARPSRAPS